MPLMSSRADAALWILCAVAVPFVIALPFLSGSIFLFRDILTYCMPQQAYAAKVLAQGHLPQWNPFVMGGIPFLAEPGTGVFYPLNLVFHVMPPWRAATAFVLLHFAVAGLGAYLLARLLGCRPLGSTMAGVCYQTSGYFLSMHGGHYYLASTALLPLTAAALVWLAQRPSRRRLALAPLPMALMLLNGEFQGAFFAGVLGLALAPCFGTRPGRALAWAGGAIALGALVGSVQLLPSALFATLTVRARPLTFFEASAWSLHPIRILEFLVRSPLGANIPSNEYWGGFFLNSDRSIAWAMALYVCPAATVLAFAPGWRKATSSAKVLWVVLGVSLLLASGSFLPVFRLWYELVPMASRFRYPEKFASVATLCLCLLAAPGLDSLNALRRRTMRLALGLGATFALLWALTSLFEPRQLLDLMTEGLRRSHSSFPPNEALQSLRTALVHTALAFVGAASATALASTRPSLASALMVALATADGLSSAAALLSYGDGSFFATKPDVVDRVLQAIPPSSAGRFVYDRPCEYTDAYGGPGTQIERGMSWEYARGRPNFLTLFGLRDVAGYTAMEIPEKKAATALAGEETSERYARLFGAAVRLVCADGSLTVQRIGNPLPRAFVVPGKQVSREVVGQALRDARFDFARLALVDGPVANSPERGERRATATEERPELLRVLVAGVGGVLVLADTFAPGWSGSLDGRPVPILRVNGLYRGVEVPPGEHEVVLKYETPGLRSGALLTLTALGVLLVLLLTTRTPHSR
jgi:hypothetical protein